MRESKDPGGRRILKKQFIQSMENKHLVEMPDARLPMGLLKRNAPELRARLRPSDMVVFCLLSKWKVADGFIVIDDCCLGIVLPEMQILRIKSI